jgi:hypothetical protein
MITRAQIEKLGALHAVEPTMLSLYLAVPPRPPVPVRGGTGRRGLGGPGVGRGARGRRAHRRRRPGAGSAP